MSTFMSKRVHRLQKNYPLCDDEIRMVAPSIFTSSPHHRMSEKYAEIPTIDVLNGLRKEGFQPFMVAQTQVRDIGRREFTKHMLRLRREVDVNSREANEIILLNSHDGSSSYQMISGVLRFVCMNGLVCGDNIQDVKIRHHGDVVGRVIDGAYSIVDEFSLIDEHKEAMRAIELKRSEQIAFATAALSLKYDGAAPISADQLLYARRREDDQNDLWTTFNRVQENLIKGGLRGKAATGRRIRTREVTGVNNDVKLNKALWTLAEEMTKLAA